MGTDIPSDLQGRIMRLERGYTECLEDLQHWASYASDYFQEKWDLAGDIAKHAAIIEDTYDFRCPTDELLGCIKLEDGETVDQIMEQIRGDR